MAFLLGGALSIAAGAVGLAACSDDTGTGLPIGGNDSGGQDSTVDTGKQDTGTPSDGGGDTGNCGTTPFVKARSEAGVNCYRGKGKENCAAGEHCCEQANTFHSCSAAGTACVYEGGVGRDYECVTPVDCVGALAGGDAGDAGDGGDGGDAAVVNVPVCCAKGTTAPRPNCSYEQVAPGFSGGKCTANVCGDGELRLCVKNADCGDAGVCTAINAFGTFIGYCK
jgi:hypothetical protein